MRRSTSLLVMAGRGTGDGHSPEDRSPSSLSAVGGPDWLLPGVDDGDEATDYRRRCMLLEASLVKFKEKATRVRQLFTVKVCFQLHVFYCFMLHQQLF